MNETPKTQSVGTPWHLWLVGVLATIWNGFGAFDFTATVTRWAPYMSNYTEEQQAFFYSFPAWQYVIWALEGIHFLAAGTIFIYLSLFTFRPNDV